MNAKNSEYFAEYLHTGKQISTDSGGSGIGNS